MPRFIWWLIYTVFGLWMQKLLPGVDFLAPGLIVSLQVKNYKETFWLALVWILIQEGIGSLAFGSTFLWYAGLILFFFFLRFYLASQSAYFVILLASFTGIWHFIVVAFMANLQEMVFSPVSLWRESLQQVIVFPVLWILIRFLYLRFNLYQNAK